jgi:hypothetical protein
LTDTATAEVAGVVVAVAGEAAVVVGASDVVRGPVNRDSRHAVVEEVAQG